MKKRLWVVEFRPGNASVIPSPELTPDYEDDIEIIVADQFFSVVEAEYEQLNRIVSDYAYCRITGQPADGRWIGEGGDEVYIHNATILETEEELWNALGLKPQDFGGETWDEVDDDVGRDQVASF
jgi:hypothetical protein